MEKLGRQFLPLWSTTFGLQLDYFDRFFTMPHLTMSLLHYPPQKEVGNKQYGIAPHTDNSLMTFLATSDVPGLAVRMPSGHWRLVETLPGALVVNTGNLMVRWTNGEYLSTKHRVINTNTVDRYSIPTFFGPSGDALIECLPTCQGPTGRRSIRRSLIPSCVTGIMREATDGMGVSLEGLMNCHVREAVMPHRASRAGAVAHR